ncbi:MAG: metallophosphoesterase [Flavobacteriales bacterium]|nr:metallophosphoesterase [Flavobacteriales bacterium]
MNYTAIFIFLAIAALIEWGAFVAFRGWVPQFDKYFWIYLVLTVVSYLFFLSFPWVADKNKYAFVNVFFIIFFGKLIAAILVLLGLGANKLVETVYMETPVSQGRRDFIKKTSALVGLFPMALMTWGIFRTAGNFKIHRVRLQLNKMPEAFKGLKIVQISDIHTGSFFSKARMQEAVDEILELKPDMVLFSGDLVNNRTDECDDYVDILSQIKAPMGVYSTLGNHDYGDYEKWSGKEEKLQNFEAMLQTHRALGWDLLMNEHRIFERNGDKIALMGVENWGANLRFPKYGKLNQAYEGTQDIPVKILISHDPSHWEAEVLKNYEDISLTVSGHTHGFQFGVEIPGIKWSPSQWVYKQWAGLYEQSGKYLYVNRGLGCIGYMGRVGIQPEITLFELT